MPYARNPVSRILIRSRRSPPSTPEGPVVDPRIVRKEYRRVAGHLAAGRAEHAPLPMPPPLQMPWRGGTRELAQRQRMDPLPDRAGLFIGGPRRNAPISRREALSQDGTRAERASSGLATPKTEGSSWRSRPPHARLVRLPQPSQEREGAQRLTCIRPQLGAERSDPFAEAVCRTGSRSPTPRCGLFPQAGCCLCAHALRCCVIAFDGAWVSGPCGHQSHPRILRNIRMIAHRVRFVFAPSGSFMAGCGTLVDPLPRSASGTPCGIGSRWQHLERCLGALHRPLMLEAASRARVHKSCCCHPPDRPRSFLHSMHARKHVA